MVSRVIKVWRGIMRLLEGGGNEISGSRKFSRVSSTLGSHSCSFSPTSHLSLTIFEGLPHCFPLPEGTGPHSLSCLVQFPVGSQEEPCLPPHSSALLPTGAAIRLGCRAGSCCAVVRKQSWDVGIKQRPQLCCCWHGCPHACDNPSLGSGGSAGMW